MDYKFRKLRLEESLLDMEGGKVLQSSHPNNQTDSRASASGPFFFSGVRNLLKTILKLLRICSPRFSARSSRESPSAHADGFRPARRWSPRAPRMFPRQSPCRGRLADSA